MPITRRRLPVRTGHGPGVFVGNPSAIARAPVVPVSAAPAPSPAQAAPDPSQDPQYMADAALRAFERRQKLDQLTQDSANATTDYGEAIRRMHDSRTQSIDQTKITANKQGLFYSGQLGKRLGDVDTDYARRESDANRDYTRAQAAREAAKRAIESGAPLEEASALAAAATRQVNEDTAAADAGVLAPNPPNPAASKPAAAPTVRTPTRTTRPARRRRGTTISHGGGRFVGRASAVR